MAKFSHTQSTLLTMAAARQDGAATVPTNTRNAAATKAAAGLVERKLMREMRTRKGMPVWREDDAGRRVSLVITGAGRNALGAEDIGKKDKDSDIIASRDSKITRAASRRSS